MGTGDVAVDEAPAALPYVHDATGDVAVDDSPAALPYVHDATGDVAVAYVHEEPVVAPVAVAAPAVTYAAYPYTYGAYPYLAAGAVVPKVEVKAAEAPAAVAPVTYAPIPTTMLTPTPLLPTTPAVSTTLAAWCPAPKKSFNIETKRPTEDRKGHRTTREQELDIGGRSVGPTVLVGPLVSTQDSDN